MGKEYIKAVYCQPAYLTYMQSTALTYSFLHLKLVCCSVFSSNCCFLTCIQISHEAYQMVWYSHLFKNFPQFVVIHTVQGFGIVDKADFFLQLSCFFDDPTHVGSLISGPIAFSKCTSNIWKFTVHILLKPGLENFEHYFASNVRWVRLCGSLNILCTRKFKDESYYWVGDGQGGLACCNLWGCKESDTTVQLKWTHTRTQVKVYLLITYLLRRDKDKGSNSKH